MEQGPAESEGGAVFGTIAVADIAEADRSLPRGGTQEADGSLPGGGTQEAEGTSSPLAGSSTELDVHSFAAAMLRRELLRKTSSRLSRRSGGGSSTAFSAVSSAFSSMHGGYADRRSTSSEQGGQGGKAAAGGQLFFSSLLNPMFSTSGAGGSGGGGGGQLPGSSRSSARIMAGCADEAGGSAPSTPVFSGSQPNPMFAGSAAGSGNPSSSRAFRSLVNPMFARSGAGSGSAASTPKAGLGNSVFGRGGVGSSAAHASSQPKPGQKPGPTSRKSWRYKTTMQVLSKPALASSGSGDGASDAVQQASSHEGGLAGSGGGGDASDSAQQVSSAHSMLGSDSGAGSSSAQQGSSVRAMSSGSLALRDSSSSSSLYSDSGAEAFAGQMMISYGNPLAMSSRAGSAGSGVLHFVAPAKPLLSSGGAMAGLPVLHVNVPGKPLLSGGGAASPAARASIHSPGQAPSGSGSDGSAEYLGPRLALQPAASAYLGSSYTGHGQPVKGSPSYSGQRTKEHGQAGAFALPSSSTPGGKGLMSALSSTGNWIVQWLRRRSGSGGGSPGAGGAVWWEAVLGMPGAGCSDSWLL